MSTHLHVRCTGCGNSYCIADHGIAAYDAFLAHTLVVHGPERLAVAGLYLPLLLIEAIVRSYR